MLLAQLLISLYLLPHCSVSALPRGIQRPIFKRSLLEITKGLTKGADAEILKDAERTTQGSSSTVEAKERAAHGLQGSTENLHNAGNFEENGKSASSKDPDPDGFTMHEWTESDDEEEALPETLKKANKPSESSNDGEPPLGSHEGRTPEGHKKDQNVSLNDDEHKKKGGEDHENKNRDGDEHEDVVNNKHSEGNSGEDREPRSDPNNPSGHPDDAEDEKRARLLNQEHFKSSKKSRFLQTTKKLWKGVTKPFKIVWNRLLNVLTKRKSSSSRIVPWLEKLYFKDVSVHSGETQNQKILRELEQENLPLHTPRENEITPTPIAS